MAQPLRFIEKTLEGGRSKNELTPRLDPYDGWGLEESWTHTKTEHTVIEQQTPKGVKIRKDLFSPTKSHGYTPEGSDLDERESPSQVTPWAIKEGQGS